MNELGTSRRWPMCAQLCSDHFSLCSPGGGAACCRLSHRLARAQYAHPVPLRVGVRLVSGPKDGATRDCSYGGVGLRQEVRCSSCRSCCRPAVVPPPAVQLTFAFRPCCSTVAALLAERLGWPMHEGDAYHPPANIAKMQVRQMPAANARALSLSATWCSNTAAGDPVAACLLGAAGGRPAGGRRPLALAAAAVGHRSDAPGCLPARGAGLLGPQAGIPPPAAHRQAQQQQRRQKQQQQQQRRGRPCCQGR